MPRNAVVAALTVLSCASVLRAGVVMDTVTVGNHGNAGELTGEGAGGWGPTGTVGGVDYAYEIGRYEVTAGQYTAFLNAVAATDTYGLYTTHMWSAYHDGCRIEREGSPGSYTYRVAPDWANRPVNLVSFWDAARFANWLHNGQPTGPQDRNTTEDGSYVLNGDTAFTRAPGATWVIPTEDEWYKAAYHKNDGATGNYWAYPTGTDLPPGNDLIDPDPGNNANYRILPDDYTVGTPYYRTEVGEFENSASPYGTFDQGGNVWEWNETLISTPDYLYLRGLRGGSYDNTTNNHILLSTGRGAAPMDLEGARVGFRVAYIPEPTALALLIIGSVALVRRWAPRHYKSFTRRRTARIESPGPTPRRSSGGGTLCPVRLRPARERERAVP